MALLVLSGQPCSGKSTVAAALKQLLTSKGIEVTVLDEPGLSLKRNHSYKGKSPASSQFTQCFVVRRAELAATEGSFPCVMQIQSARKTLGAA